MLKMTGKSHYNLELIQDRIAALKAREDPKIQTMTEHERNEELAFLERLKLKKFPASVAAA